MFRRKSPEDTKQPKTSAHRGGIAKGIEENTLPAFERAITLGADEIELDVHVTKDGHLVVIHDEDVKRTTTGKGNVEDMTLKELKKLHIVDKNGKTVTDKDGQVVKIPTLEEVLDLIQAKNSNIGINIELKTDVFDYQHPAPGIEKKVIDLVEKEKYQKLFHQLNFSSFNHETLKRLKELRPNYTIGQLYDYDDTNKKHTKLPDEPSQVINKAIAMGAKSINPDVHSLLENEKKAKELIKLCHENDIQLKTWVLNSKKAMKKLAKWGFDRNDTLITDHPERVLQKKRSPLNFFQNPKRRDEITNVLTADKQTQPEQDVPDR